VADDTAGGHGNFSPRKKLIGQSVYNKNMLTENDQKEELSYAYVHAVSSFAGFSCERTSKDRDSVDTRILAKGRLTSDSKIESPSIELQLKATCDLTPHGADQFSFPLPIKNYDDLRKKTQNPRYLVVFDMPAEKDTWLTLTTDSLIERRCAYWVSILGQPDLTNQTNRTVYIPKVNLFNAGSLRTLLEQASELRHLL
jgi:hypothetical protein